MSPQMGGHIDVITAEQAGAYKPSRQIFAHAHASLGVTPTRSCTSAPALISITPPRLDIGFRCVWIDRGTGRQCLPDYRPDATVSTLDQVIGLFRQAGWI